MKVVTMSRDVGAFCAPTADEAAVPIISGRDATIGIVATLLRRDRRRRPSAGGLP
jgi:hypothetical protein